MIGLPGDLGEAARNTLPKGHCQKQTMTNKETTRKHKNERKAQFIN
jgi:hypothetical protein